jgi:gliding motility-associated-like protein
MDWKNYQVDPGKGVFEKIQRRVRLRHAMRIGAVVTVIAAVMTGVAIALFPKEKPQTAIGLSHQAVAPVTSGSNADNASLSMPESQKQSLDSVSVAKPVEHKATAGEASVQPSNDAATPVVVIDHQPHPSTENMVSEIPQSSTAGASAPAQDIHQQEQENDLAETLDTDFAFIVPQSTIESIKADPPQPEPYHEDNVLWVPNIIIPSSDTEELRFFSVKATSALSNFHIYIYNRGGRQLFSSTDPQFVWNATVNGTPVPQGAYVWVISYRDSNNIPCQRTGTVTVVR